MKYNDEDDNLFEKMFEEFVKTKVNLEKLEKRKVNGNVTTKDKLIIMIKFLEYAQENKDTFVQRGPKKKYIETPEERKERLKKYYEARKEQTREYYKEYRKNNKEKFEGYTKKFRKK